MARQPPTPPVDDELRTLVHSQLDIAFDLLLVFAGHDRTHLRMGINGDAYPQLGNLFEQNAREPPLLSSVQRVRLPA